MKKIILLVLVGILILNVFGTGFAFSIENKQEIQYLHSSNQKIINNKFEIEAKYSYIRSYPEGGGIFIIKMTPKNGFSGYVSLQINTDSNLNAQLDRKTLNQQSQVAEITIEPNESTELKTYDIILTATYHKKSKHMTFFNWISKIKLPFLSNLINLVFNRYFKDYNYEYISQIKETLVLEVEMFDWSSDNLPDAIIKRDDLIKWLEAKHPEFGNFSGENWFAYLTYPAHLIVEHWTFLYEKWEMRICYHVTIPPYNWSMICLRPRGEVDAIFAAKRESDATTYEIPISDYPIFYGY